MAHRLSRGPGVRGWTLSGLLLGLTLTACAGPRAYDVQPRADQGACTFYKVGEVREVPFSDVQRAMRRMGGDFVQSRPDAPGGRSTYSAEVFRYHDPQCANRR